MAFYKFTGSVAEYFPSIGLTAKPGYVYDFGNNAPPNDPFAKENQPSPLPLSKWTSDPGPATDFSLRGMQASDLAGVFAPTTGSFIDVSLGGYGAVDNTGVVDSSTALNAALAAAAVSIFTKRVYVRTGTYKLASAIVPQQGVELFGDGISRTILKPVGSVAAIAQTTNQFNLGAPLTNAVFRDFEIDGTGQDLTGVGGVYSAAIKGIFIQYLTDCRFENLYIHDTPASGLGVDDLHGACLIRGVHVFNCGRLNDGTQPGGSGIGIGYHADTVDAPLIIDNCHAMGNKRYGIFVEDQTGSATTDDFGVTITNSYASGNKVGFGLAGSRRSAVLDCVASSNTVAGIALDSGTFSPGRQAIDSVIANNRVFLNVIGIQLNYVASTSANGKTSLAGNEINFNTDAGISIDLDTVSPACLNLHDNYVHDNAKSGIRARYNGSTNNASIVQSEFIDNVVFNNGTAATVGDKDGIRIGVPCTDVRIEGNRAYDRQASKTQGFGIVVTATFTGGSIWSNDARNNLTGAVSLTGTISASTRLGSNAGHTPTAPAAVTVTASPQTITDANLVPSWLFITGGTVSSVTLAGVLVASNTDVAVPVEPGDAVVVTYSVAPTISSRRR